MCLYMFLIILVIKVIERIFKISIKNLYYMMLLKILIVVDKEYRDVGG